MSTYIKPEQVEIVYFTGTGGTQRAAACCASEFRKRGIPVHLHEIHKNNVYTHKYADLLILLYPVYAFNAPQPVYDFIHELPKAYKNPAVILSVSGGGEITPNTACRLHSIRRLEKKGYQVVYEQMLVMPSNFASPIPDELSIRLLRILPKKTELIINDLLSGVVRRTNPNLLNRLASKLGELEKLCGATILFGKHIHSNKKCNGCGLCAKSCPSGNIQMENKKPHFNNSCLLCMKCIYGCPAHALEAGLGDFLVFKKGYNLIELEKQMSGKKLASVKELTKGYGYKGIRDYLKTNK